MTFDEMRGRASALTEELAGKLKKKLPYALRKAQGLSFIPYTVKDGEWASGPAEEGICWWTNGFWPALMWAGYRLTGDEAYRAEAERAEAMLDDAFRDFDGLHHDVGFMWLISAGVNYALTGNDDSRKRLMLAANLLAGRYNPAGFIRAWNGDRTGWAIIDCMMNLNLLYRASELTGDPRFAAIARRHADTAQRYFVREDGTCSHIVIFDPVTGEMLDDPAGQGYASGSAWSRGQAWAIYGFALSFRHTGNGAYQKTARRVADRFIEEVKTDWVPKCDFRQPADSDLKDACAGAVAAAGFLELAEQTGEERYFEAALHLLKALDETCADWTEDSPAIITHCASAWDGDHDIAMVYADFYFAEAVLRLSGDPFRFW